jgi:hypothetical protein
MVETKGGTRQAALNLYSCGFDPVLRRHTMAPVERRTILDCFTRRGRDWRSSIDSKVDGPNSYSVLWKGPFMQPNRGVA